MLKKSLTAFSILTFVVSSSLFARPEQRSLRSSSTAGLFGDSYDVLIGTPYFLSLGKAKKNKTVKEEVAKPTKKADKEQVKSSDGNVLPLNYNGNTTIGRMNIFTGLNDLNNDGTLLLGGTYRFGDFGFGAYMEFRKYKTADTVSGLLGTNANPGFGNTNLAGTVLSGKSGNAAETKSDYYDPSKTGNASEEAVLKADASNYTDFANINFKLATSYALNKDLNLGLAFERYSTSSQTSEWKGNYSFTHNNLLSSVEDYKFTETLEGTDEQSQTHNVISLFSSMSKLGPFSLVAFNLDLDKNSNTQDRIDVDNTKSTTLSQLESNDTKNLTAYDDSAFLIAPSFTAWLPVGKSWELETTLGMAIGSNAKANIGSLSQTTSINTVNLTNSDVVNTSSDKQITKNTLDDNSFFAYNLDVFARRRLAKNMLLGFGLTYNHSVDDFTVSVVRDNNKVVNVNDGNGIDDAADYVQIIKSGSTLKNQTITTIDVFSLPVGIEYFISANFSLRLGFVHTYTITNTETSRKLTKNSPEEIDNNSAAIPDNESNNDIYSSENSAADNSQNGIVRNITQTNSLSLGFGYTAGENLQFDMAIASDDEGAATGQQFFDASKMMFKATLLF